MTTPTWTLPNKAARALLLELEQLLGKNGLITVLKMAGLTEWQAALPPENLDRNVGFTQISALNRGVETIYGDRGARGLLKQANRASFPKAWSEEPALDPLKQLASQDTPTPERIAAGCKVLCEVFTGLSDMDLQLTESGGHPALELSQCPECLGLQAKEPACAGMAGWIEGALGIIAPGESLHAVEHECLASGHARCLFAIQPGEAG